MAHELSIRVALRAAQLVVEVADVWTPAGFHQGVEECDRIRAARYTYEQRLIWREHLRESSLDLGEHDVSFPSVTLSVAKGLARIQARFFALLRMTT